MKRVAIIGCPGSGKTTFARQLAEKSGLPLVHLDLHYHSKAADYYHNKEAWIEKVEELVAQDTWIMDGNYSSTFKQRFERADTIIFFDYPRRLSLYGVAKRRIEYRNKLRPDMPEGWKEKANLEFWRYVWRFNGESRDRVMDALNNNKHKEVIIFKNRREATEYIEKL